ncbi:MAG: tRNA1(Val) (adenine(37)-N6)-methyltransferase [Lachnospiraceae bacterium]|nr:tRNA1(Val) (adenine(37)-N6)-methyltransferase [Lachnospiraceae bacterium]
METALREGERIDELGRKGYRLIQDTHSFCFGIDAVLLADFAQASEKESVCDLGCGNGILPLLLKGRDKGGRITGLEIQPEAARLARRNLALNGLEESAEIIEGDIREASALFGRASFDVVVSNPPYREAGGGLVNPDPGKAIARHEILCTLEDVIREGAALLKPAGRFFMVHRPRRLSQILSLLPQYGLAAKTLRFVHGSLEKEADMVLLEAVRGGRAGLIVQKPLILYREDGSYIEEVKEIYYG